MKKKQKRGILLLLGFSLMIQHTRAYGELIAPEFGARTTNEAFNPLYLESWQDKITEFEENSPVHLVITRVARENPGYTWEFAGYIVSHVWGEPYKKINFRACFIVDDEEKSCYLVLDSWARETSEERSLPIGADPFVDLIRNDLPILEVHTTSGNIEEYKTYIKEELADRL